jgi:hypothetical protein
MVLQGRGVLVAVAVEKGAVLTRDGDGDCLTISDET